MCVLSITRLLEGWVLVNRINHTSGVIVATPPNRPKSVRNRCIIEVFGDVFFLGGGGGCHVAFLEFSVVVGFFCHRTESDLFLFF